jgi:hypothetical protein
MLFRVNITDTFLITAEDADEAENRALAARGEGNLAEPAVEALEVEN